MAENGKGIAIALDSIPLPRSGPPFSPELQAAYEEAFRVDYEANRNRYEGSLESFTDQPYPETAPAFVSIVTDSDEQIWLRRWTPDYGKAGEQILYDVITADGTHVATIHLPTGSRILWAGDGQILLLERDDLDVQHVRLYEVVEVPAS